MRKKLRKFISIISIAIVLLSTFISGFYPVYYYRQNTIFVKGVPYTQYPLSDWHPTGKKYKIANLCGEVPLISFLYMYEGDNPQFFVYMSSFPSDAEALPFHRSDIPLPSFSADVIDSVTCRIGSEMLRGNNDEDKEITITDKVAIGAIAACFSYPVEMDATKEIDAYALMDFSAKSNQYENMIYEIGVVVYHGKYCLMKRDGSLYEIPLPLLENLLNLEIVTPEQYVNAEETSQY